MRAFIAHLRLPFNYVLMPLFVWGAYLSGGQIGANFWIGLLSFHLFVYGGTNMFNSYYDQDEGPIGGLENPSKVGRDLFWSSIGLKFIGLLLALNLNGTFVACYLAFCVYSVVYSHPAIRMKRRPLGSAVLVFFGQGIVGGVAGWAATDLPVRRLLESPLPWSLIGGALMTSGMYPLTQVYQIEEDRNRDDLTLARWFGPKRVFVYIGVMLALGVSGVSYAFWQLGSRPQCAVFAAYFAGVLLVLVGLRGKLTQLSTVDTYRRVMTLFYVNATVILSLLAAAIATA